MVSDNKLGITDPKALADAEERIGKTRARELYDSGRLGTIPVGTYASLAEIHKKLFGDVYENAGEFRTVNIYKGDCRFAPVEGLEPAVKFAEIMSQDSFDEIIDKYVQMNNAHPFRTGNSVALRIWLDVMFAAAFGQLVDWRRVPKQQYLVAMEHCGVDDRDLEKLIRAALTDKVGRDMFMDCLDASFALSGYTQYKTVKL